MIDQKSAISARHGCVRLRLGSLRLGFIVASLLLGSGGLAGCGGEVEGASLAAPQSASHVYIEAFSSFHPAASETLEPLTLFEDPRGTVYSLTAAQLGVGSIRFIFPESLSCAQIDYQSPEFSKNLECSGGSLILRGPFRVDLRARQDRAERMSWEIPALDYRRVELHLAPVSAPTSELRTLQARASFESDNTIRELSLDFRFHATLSAPLNAALAPQQTLMLGLDVAGWLTRISVSDCLRRGYLGDPRESAELDSSFDAPNYATFMYTSPPKDCSDAQSRFRSNLIDSLRAKNDEEAPN